MRTNPNHPEVNHWVRNPEEYFRRYDLLNIAQRDSATYLQTRTGEPYAKCLAYVVKQTSDLESQNVLGLKRGGNGDRSKAKIPFLKLLEDAQKNERVLTPNLIMYESWRKNMSYLSKFVDDRLIERGTVKKRGFVAKQQGDKKLAGDCNIDQLNIKLDINSISGAHCSEFNFLFNHTSHSALTSTCRTATGYSNAIIEWMLGGNRHYRTAEVTFTNITSLISNMDTDKLNDCIAYRDIHLPTVDETLDWILESSRKYFSDANFEVELKAYLTDMSPVQRAAVLYTSDFKALYTFNDKLVRWFFDQNVGIIDKPTITIQEAQEIVGKVDDDIAATVGIFCGHLLKGTTPKDLLKKNPDGYRCYAETITRLIASLDGFNDVIDTFMVTTDVPPQFWDFDTSIRTVVLGSDTDSSMFTAQNQVEWYCNGLDMGHVGDSVGALVCYMASQKVAHLLALASKQMGVADEKLYRLKMKNEYAFKIYMVANRAKHYATLKMACEGNVYEEGELEVKGVGLKDSKRPDFLNHQLHDLLVRVMNEIIETNGIDMSKYLIEIAKIEQDLIDGIASGDTSLLTTGNLKAQTDYANPEQSIYKHHEAWKHIWQPTYGTISEPPYRVVKVGLNKDGMSKADVIANIAKLPNGIQAEFAKRYVKDGRLIGTALLPTEVTETTGVIPELLPFINTRGLVYELMGGFYIALEMFGFYYRNDNQTRLISDDIKQEHLSK